MLNLIFRPIRQFAVSKKQKSLYDVLKISRSANQQEVKASYYKLAKQCHPDTHQGSPNIAQTFKEINEAYNTLRDPQKRREYDENNYTSEGEKKQYKFYDTQHTYGYSQKTYQRRTNQSGNESSFNSQNPYRQSGANPYNGDFSSFYKQSKSESQPNPNPNQSWEEYVRNEHRKNIAQNKKTAMNRLKQSNTIMIIVMGVVSIYIIGQLTFKIYEFNNSFRARSYAERLDPSELYEYRQAMRQGGGRRDFY